MEHRLEVLEDQTGRLVLDAESLLDMIAVSIRGCKTAEAETELRKLHYEIVNSLKMFRLTSGVIDLYYIPITEERP